MILRPAQLAIMTAILCQPVMLSAQSGPLRDMATDRPNATNTPSTVDVGRVQLEFGMLDRATRRDAGERQRTISIGETNLRVGVADTLEFNLVVRPYRSERLETGTTGMVERARGFDDMTVGGKLNLWGNDPGDEAWATALAIQPQFTLPTAKRSLGAGKVEGSVALPFTMRLPAGFGMNLQPTVSRVRGDGADAGFVTAYQGAIEIDHDLGPLNLYAEYVFDDTDEAGAPNKQVANLGSTAGLGPNLMLDANLALGLNRAADDVRFLCGVSVRF